MYLVTTASMRGFRIGREKTSWAYFPLASYESGHDGYKTVFGNLEAGQ